MEKAWWRLEDSKSFWSKNGLIVIGGGAVLCATLYALYRRYRYDDRDEGFVDFTKTDEPAEKKVLVLGLDGSGKSSILIALAANNVPDHHRPNDSFNVVNISTAKQTLALWEIGGSMAVRKYWSSFVQDTRILVYVVDSADEKRLPEAFSELHRILGDERLFHIPIIIVANKQDVPEALDQESILSALAMDHNNRQRHPVHYVATAVLPDGCVNGISDLRLLLDNLS